MKQYVLLLTVGCLLAGCNAGPRVTESGPRPFRSTYECEVPQMQDFPPLQTVTDLVVNMRHLSQHAQARNFVAGQWIIRNDSAAERERIRRCSALILQSSREIIEHQSRAVFPHLDTPAQREALGKTLAAWNGAMQDMTPQGVNSQALAAFNRAADSLLSLHHVP